MAVEEESGLLLVVHFWPFGRGWCLVYQTSSVALLFLLLAAMSPQSNHFALH